MRKMIIFVAAMTLLCWSEVDAQHVNVIFRANTDTVAYWLPEVPDPGDTVTIYYNDIPGTLPDDDPRQVKLHWGINQDKPGNWKEPPEEIWPPETVPWGDGKSVQSPMTRNPQNLWEISIASLDTFRTLHFVVTNGVLWDNNNSANWDIYFGEGPPPPPEHKDTVEVNYLVDMSQAIVNRGFIYGDTVEVRVGYFATAAEVATVQLLRQGITSFYTGSATVTTTIDSLLDYRYFAYASGTENPESYYNFSYTGETQGEAQVRQVKVTGNIIAVADTVMSNSNPRRMPFFRNMSGLAQDVLVTFTCDVRPAIYQVLAGDTLKDIQGIVDVTDADSILAWGVAINGPATGGWSDPEGGTDWGRHLMDRETKRMYDDGTHGDVVAGDSIYTIRFQYSKDSTQHVIGQEFKFGIDGGDNEGGYGNNHIENIDDYQSTFTVNAQFGSIDPVFYWAWDYDSQSPATGVEELAENIPLKYGLAQNYPNPFNPETSIEYSIMKPEKVTLIIYNLLGQKVVALVDKKQLAGSHVVTWDGRDNRGRIVSSGVYFYKIEAGNFVKTHKMLLLR